MISCLIWNDLKCYWFIIGYLAKVYRGEKKQNGFMVSPLFHAYTRISLVLVSPSIVETDRKKFQDFIKHIQNTKTEMLVCFML